ncbi:MAG TPA: tetratricopeptide repeat protein, partial [Bacteroidia bacterium]|nr:tetratricopeptide repeat protein [Bacteroidia bacterium]
DFDPDAPRFQNTAENLAMALGFLAELLMLQGGYEEAEALFLRSIEVQEKLVGPDGLNVADPLEQLAQLYDVQGRYEEAAALIQRRIGIFEKDEYGKDEVAMCLYDLAA